MVFGDCLIELSVLKGFRVDFIGEQEVYKNTC